jgi:hypothetical protein
MAEHPRLASVVAPSVCRFCKRDIWWDEETETYETADEVFLCHDNTDPYMIGHDPAITAG